ncbi:lysophospholipid acyltransferase family protein [Nonomuraea fuscirosea]|uniref:lysophospholipid acyltransferase family protein n=1 Tax=Nonomuraea fuscirosea TaxID=1291556 RepID=UPI003405DF41
MYYCLAVMNPILRLVLRPWAEGVENVPEEGPVILASNHLSHSDTIFGWLHVKRRVTQLAGSHFFSGRGIKGFLMRLFLNGIGTVPIDRSGGKASEAGLSSGLRVLNEGNVLGIYPEGTRSRDGRLYKGRTGVARLALASRAPVIPCAMINTFEIMPPGRLLPKLGIRPGVKFGKPLDFSRYHGMEGDRLVVRAVTDEVMHALMDLSGQEYVDDYAVRTTVSKG